MCKILHTNSHIKPYRKTTQKEGRNEQRKNKAPSGAIKHNTYTGKELTGYLVGLAGQNIIYNIIAGGLQYYWQSIIFCRRWPSR